MTTFPLLVEHFLARASEQTNRSITAVSADALELLAACDWPGNIRQLENAMLRAVVLADGDRLTAAEFPQIRALVEGIDAGREELVPPPLADDALIALFRGRAGRWRRACWWRDIPSPRRSNRCG